MKSLELTLRLLTEVGSQLGIETTRDRKTISERCMKEGSSFLTITLPALSKAIISACDKGVFSIDQAPGFAAKRPGGLPVFLQGFLKRIFTRHDGGSWYIDQDVDSVATHLKALRQVLELHGKVFRACSPARERAAKRQFVHTDRSLTYSLSPLVSELFHALFGRSLGTIEKRLFSDEVLVFGHGPGAVSERYANNQKWEFPYWTDALQAVVPWWSVIRTTGEIVRTHGECEPEMLGTKPTSRLVSVPKTAKAPRLIAIEPVAHQYVQQGLLNLFDEELRSAPVWRFIDWHDQLRNQSLAKQGSRDGSLATLDLSEASDRLSWGLVRDLLKHHPYLLRWISACRTESIEVDGDFVSLKKFASMGSALTFPLQTMVFFTIAAAGTYGSVPRALKALRGPVECSAYGDDIVVPVGKMSDVVRLLTEHGLKVNSAKSFGTGSFRESCGGDFFAGQTVKPVKVRKWIDDPCTSEWLEKTCHLRNRLFDGGYFETASWIDSLLGDLPSIPVGSPAIGLWTYDSEKIRTRYNKDLQRSEYRVIRIERTAPTDVLEGYAALRKCLAPRRSNRPLSERHLLESGRPRTGKAKYGWSAAA